MLSTKTNSIKSDIIKYLNLFLVFAIKTWENYNREQSFAIL